MADYIVQEDGTSQLILEDSSGALLNEVQPVVLTVPTATGTVGGVSLAGANSYGVTAATAAVTATAAAGAAYTAPAATADAAAASPALTGSYTVPTLTAAGDAIAFAPTLAHSYAVAAAESAAQAVPPDLTAVDLGVTLAVPTMVTAVEAVPPTLTLVDITQQQPVVSAPSRRFLEKHIQVPTMLATVEMVSPQLSMAPTPSQVLTGIGVQSVTLIDLSQRHQDDDFVVATFFSSPV